MRNASGRAALRRIEFVGVYTQKKGFPLFAGKYQDGAPRRIIPAVAHANVVAQLGDLDAVAIGRAPGTLLPARAC